MLAIVRIQGKTEIRREMEDTLKMLRLNDVHNCIILPESPDYKGMVEKVRNFITYGEIDKEILTKMIQKRLRTRENERIDEKTLKEITNFESFDKFANALLEGKVKLKDFENINPVFKLTPPSKGFKSIKEYYPKGDLGYRGKEINELIERMI
jgi:large subunit ribosomal protein L30